MNEFELIVIGSGPGGHKAALHAGKLGKKVAIIEQERELGGACVHRGTIPSKTLREAALQMYRMSGYSDLFNFSILEDIQVQHLAHRLDTVISSNVNHIAQQLLDCDVECIHGRAKLIDAHTVSVTQLLGASRDLSADNIVIATGSRPRHPPEYTIDHEFIFDSDSILSLAYLPQSLTILGGGIIACEYASIFAMLGVQVTIIDRATRPLGLFDPELAQEFLNLILHLNGRYVPSVQAHRLEIRDFHEVRAYCNDGNTITSDRVLVALGRNANIEGLNSESVGLEMNGRYLKVDRNCQTNVPNIYAVGDVIGPPALASTSMEQGRRAACHAFGLKSCDDPQSIPIAVYTVPELAHVGLNEQQATEQHNDIIVGRAKFIDVARGQISGAQSGLLKIIAGNNGERILGVSAWGDGAAELVHLGQLAIITQLRVQDLIDNIFNFPTLAEAYRIAALDIVYQLRKREVQAA